MMEIVYIGSESLLLQGIHFPPLNVPVLGRFSDRLASRLVEKQERTNSIPLVPFFPITSVAISAYSQDKGIECSINHTGCDNE